MREFESTPALRVPRLVQVGGGDIHLSDCGLKASRTCTTKQGIQPRHHCALISHHGCLLELDLERF